MTTLIVGATSSIGVVLVHELAASGEDLLLAGRSESELALLQCDVRIRYGVESRILLLDVAETLSCEAFVRRVGDLDTVYMLIGYMGKGLGVSIENTAYIWQVNYKAPAALLMAVAKQMEVKNAGNIVVLSSVAADRRCKKNNPYAQAKAELTVFAKGLSKNLAYSNVHVMIVNPGYIDTPMTYELNSVLIANRRQTVEHIVDSLRRKKHCVYTPAYWRYIMMVLRVVPRFLYRFI